MQPAEIAWDDEGSPHSLKYGDVYFSRNGGMEESCYVFLRHNGLPGRFQHASNFTIAETGFGTGLNFLLTWQSFLEHAPPDAVLHYISVEKHPLRQEDLTRAHSLWPTLRAYAQDLQQAYPAITPGIHRLVLAKGRVRLTLLFGDAQAMLSDYPFMADAWFLDGFAPAKNAAMWQGDLLTLLPSHSTHGTTFATFTAAGDVKRGLQAAGFSVTKSKGYGTKRDMLSGRLETDKAMPIPVPPPAHVMIIGAGAAGAAAAYALAQRGTHVTIIDRHLAPALGTSSNEAAILFPFASRAWMPHTRFYLSGLSFSRQQISQFRAQNLPIAGAFCGMLQCPKPSQEEARLLEIPSLLGLDASVVKAVCPEEASYICGLNVAQGGLHWPGSGWYSLRDYTLACLSHPRIRFLGGMAIDRLERQEDGLWSAFSGANMAASADAVILANATDAPALLPEINLPLRPVRGQVTHLPVTPLTASLNTVLCFGGYLLPAHNGMHALGATYERERQDTVVLAESHRRNLALAAQAIPMPELNPSSLDGWAGLRATTPDKLPLVGPTHLPGVYATLGHGSRAALSCPLSGELLASWLHHEPLPLSPALANALHPLRF